VDVYQFGSDLTDDSFITLCPDCIDWASFNKDDAIKLFKRLITNNKIVLVGDCHGNFEKLNQVLESEYPFNFFISVGDVADFKDLISHDITSISRWKSMGYCVHGNHDEVECFNRLELIQELHGIRIASLNGILKSRNFIKDSYKNISFREILYLSHLSDIDILVTHQPPTGVFNRIGEPALEELLNYLVPKLHIFGHVHRFKLKFHLNTFMISLPIITRGYAVAYFQGRDLRNLELIFKKGKRFIKV